MRAELIKLHERLNATMIYVTHDQVEAMTMGDRIVVMRNGFIQQVGSPMEVYNEPVNQFVAGFIGSPPMNFLNARLVRNNGSYAVDVNGSLIPLPEARGKQAETYTNKEVVLGIRPEDVLSAEDAEGRNLAPIKATVEVLEPLGAEIILELSSQGQSFTGRMGPQLNVKMHDEMPVYFDMARCHLFDVQTEQAIFKKDV
jgi:multiple sugar transport system ATP-binding protein